MKYKRMGVLLAGMLAAALVFVAGCGGNAPADNPYGKSSLNPATIKSLDDPLYQNIIRPDDLARRLADGEEIFVYFFSPACSHCEVTTPVLVPVAEEFSVDLKQYNVLEFPQGWTDYNIEGTPTVVHFRDGREISRVVGAQEEAVFRTWFEGETSK